MRNIKIGIIGCRIRDGLEDLKCLTDFLEERLNDLDPDINITLVSGGCPKGGDRFAEIIAEQFELPIIIHYPDKSKLPTPYRSHDYRKICFERNTLIAQDSDILIALVAPDRKGGTEDTIRKFQKIYPNRTVFII